MTAQTPEKKMTTDKKRLISIKKKDGTQNKNMKRSTQKKEFIKEKNQTKQNTKE